MLNVNIRNLYFIPLAQDAVNQDTTENIVALMTWSDLSVLVTLTSLRTLVNSREGKEGTGSL